jgi:hypothetical protein
MSTCRARRSMASILVLLPLLLVTPRNASGQVVATSFEELRTLVKSGDTIYVTEANGRKTKARLGELTQSSLELLVRKTAPDGRETFVPQSRLAERDIRQIQIERGDSVLNGTLIGLAVVGGPWLLACNPATDWCYYNDGANLYRGLALITSGIAAGIGALIDAGIRERVLVYYQAPGRQSQRVHLSPFVSKSAAGVQMSVRF